MLDALATGLRECRSKELVGGALRLDAFFDAMLRSRISRRVIAEQHLHLGKQRPGYIGAIASTLHVGDSLEFAAQKTTQVGGWDSMQHAGLVRPAHVQVWLCSAAYCGGRQGRVAFWLADRRKQPALLR
jgi:hypothetical protein